MTTLTTAKRAGGNDPPSYGYSNDEGLVLGIISKRGGCMMINMTLTSIVIGRINAFHDLGRVTTLMGYPFKTNL
jgi:hypothetical protein